MKMKKIFFAIMISLILLISCSLKEDPNSKSKQAIESEVQIQNNSNEEEKQTDDVDLDGNGIRDKITFECQPGGYEFTLAVNDVSIYGQGENLNGFFKIIDIDITDKIKEIAISESGPSSDEKTAFYLYDGKELMFMGKVQGSNDSIKILGDGKVIAKTRGQILQTWFYEDPYKLSELHRLERIPQELYKMNSNVRVQKQLELLKSRTSSEITAVLQKDEDVIILSSDDKNWCLVENSKGEKGWFAIDNFDQIRGTNWRAQEVFEGLCYAD
jgi:hypothetical protein